MGGEGGLRVLVADGYSMFREAVRIVLESEPDVDWVFQVADIDEAARVAELERPDVTIVDSGLLPNNGRRRLDPIVRTPHGPEDAPDTRVLVLSEDIDAEVLADLIEQGALGYIAKTAPLTDLVDATFAVARGEFVIPPGMLGALLSRLVRNQRGEREVLQRHAQLTKREREVLSLLARGADNQEIGEHLVISPQTARTHIQNILLKLGVHSRLEAASLAIRAGLTSERESNGK
jgi:DNA-binding NarL/FixJ family response regulator